MVVEDFREKLHINYRHLIQKYTGERDKWTQKRVEAFFDAFTKLFKEKQGGVYLDDMGYFCHINSPKRVYDGDILVKPRIPYLFTDLSIRSKINRWTMENKFNPEFTTNKDYTLHYTLLKQYKKDNDN